MDNKIDENWWSVNIKNEMYVLINISPCIHFYDKKLNENAFPKNFLSCAVV